MMQEVNKMEGNKTISAKVPFKEYMELLHEAEEKKISLNQLFLSRIFPSKVAEVDIGLNGVKKRLLSFMILFKINSDLNSEDMAIYTQFEDIVRKS